MSTHARHREQGGIVRRVARFFRLAVYAVSGGRSRVAAKRPIPSPRQ